MSEQIQMYDSPVGYMNEARDTKDTYVRTCDYEQALAAANEQNAKLQQIEPTWVNSRSHLAAANDQIAKLQQAHEDAVKAERERCRREEVEPLYDAAVMALCKLRKALAAANDQIAKLRQENERMKEQSEAQHKSYGEIVGRLCVAEAVGDSWKRTAERLADALNPEKETDR